jgi:cytochrome oxidase Cu insertion factor (SCO1/SenC/PrrC family)
LERPHPAKRCERRSAVRLNDPHRVAPVVVLLAFLLVPPALYSQNARFEEFTETKPMAGEIAPDFTLETVDGERFTLSEVYAEQPVVIEFGSYT